MEETAGKGGWVGCYQLESVSHTHVSTFTRSLSGTGCDNWQRDTNIRVRPRGENRCNQWEDEEICVPALVR